MLGRRLQRDGYTVQLAANGVEALRLLRAIPFDLVLLDLSHDWFGWVPGFAEHPFATYDEMKQVYDARAGFLLHTDPGVPLWVGEFGTCQFMDCGANADWFRMYIHYMQENDLAWSYWPLNGTQSSGVGRKYDSVETYGLLSPDYKQPGAPKVIELLRTVEIQPKH